MDMDEYLSIPQAAAELGRTRQTVWRHVRLGRLRAVRIGHGFVVERRELAALRGLKPGRQVQKN